MDLIAVWNASTNLSREVRGLRVVSRDQSVQDGGTRDAGRGGRHPQGERFLVYGRGSICAPANRTLGLDAGPGDADLGHARGRAALPPHRRKHLGRTRRLTGCRAQDVGRAGRGRDAHGTSSSNCWAGKRRPWRKSPRSWTPRRSRAGLW